MHSRSNEHSNLPISSYLRLQVQRQFPWPYLFTCTDFLGQATWTAQYKVTPKPQTCSITTDMYQHKLSTVAMPTDYYTSTPPHLHTLTSHLHTPLLHTELPAEPSLLNHTPTCRNYQGLVWPAAVLIELVQQATHMQTFGAEHVGLAEHVWSWHQWTGASLFPATIAMDSLHGYWTSGTAGMLQLLIELSVASLTLSAPSCLLVCHSSSIVSSSLLLCHLVHMHVRDVVAVSWRYK